MIHILELTPNSGIPLDIKPHRDFCRFLPDCDPGNRYTDCNWIKENLQVEWMIGSEDWGKWASLSTDSTELIEFNVGIWDKIYKSISSRVNKDMDDLIRVYCTVSNRNAGILASIVEARNVFIQNQVRNRVSQETLDAMCEYCKIFVPVYEQVELNEEEMNRRQDNRYFKWMFRRWVSI